MDAEERGNSLSRPVREFDSGWAREQKGGQAKVTDVLDTSPCPCSQAYSTGLRTTQGMASLHSSLYKIRYRRQAAYRQTNDLPVKSWDQPNVLSIPLAG